MNVRGVKPDNRVVEVRKMSDGSLHAVSASGKTFVISADHDVAQAFLIHTMLHADELREVAT
jgi:hypothetical protein